MAIRHKTLVTQSLAGECCSHSLTKVYVRDVGLVIDEPEARGGTNQGPSPTETMMGALIGCTNVITHKIALEHRIDIESMSLGVEADFDRRGATLAQEIDVPFPKLVLVINLTVRASAEQIERLKEDLKKFCPVSKVLRQAGTVIEEHWDVEYR